MQIEEDWESVQLDELEIAEVTETKPAQTYESWCVLLFLAAFWLFGVLTATGYPFNHMDESEFATPAISYLHGQGFQMHFSEMISLYCFLLVPWVKFFGGSLRSIRAAEITTVTTAFFVLWLAVRRLGLIAQPFARILLLFLLATEYGIIVSYRTGRYDGLGFLLIAAVLWCMSIENQGRRLGLLSAIFLFVPWAGLQFLPLEFTAALVLALLFRVKYWKEIAVSFLASGIGTAFFFSALFVSGRLPTFMKLLHVQQRNFFGSLLHGRFDHHNAIPANYSLPFIFMAAIIMLFGLGISRFRRAYTTLQYVILFTVCLTVILIATSKFPTYYSYMVTIPLMIGICAGLAVCDVARTRNTVAALCAFSTLVGVGIHLFIFSFDRQDRDYYQVQRFIEQTVRPDDIAYADHVGYMAVKNRAHDVYLPTSDWDIIPLMSKEQKDSITVLILRPEYVSIVPQELGGNWKPTGEALIPQGHIFLGGKLNLGFLTISDAHLLVFRRV